MSGPIEALAPLVEPIDSFKPHPDHENPRRGDLDAIARSLERFGQLRPALARENGLIVAGNHTWKAAKLLGWTEFACARHKMSKARAREYLLADNRLAELGSYDEAVLAEQIKLVHEESAVGFEATGWSESEYDDLMEAQRKALDGDERGKLLALADVSVAEPQHSVEYGEVWMLDDRHVLAVYDVWQEFDAYRELAPPDSLFCPLPTPHLALSKRAAEQPLFLVTGDTYVAGHVLDKWAAVHGEDTLKSLTAVEA